MIKNAYNSRLAAHIRLPDRSWRRLLAHMRWREWHQL